MDGKTSSGICDETVDKFSEFMKMIEETLYLSEIDIQCAICQDLLQRPYEIDPCRHTFCQSCLIRLSQAGSINCPICRGAINYTRFNLKLHLALRTQHFDDYENRYTEELETGIYDIPIDWSVQLDSSTLMNIYRNARQN